MKEITLEKIIEIAELNDQEKLELSADLILEVAIGIPSNEISKKLDDIQKEIKSIAIKEIRV